VLCSRPFVRKQTGLKRVHMYTSQEARTAMSPIPCGQCLHCRINQTRIWMTRILLEQTMHPETSFVTLTYEDEKLPANANLRRKDLTNFLKRFRKRVSPRRIRYYAVGEYGNPSFELPTGKFTVGYRPHYHIALFNAGLDDTDLMEKSWDSGFVHCGELNPQSARYISGYIIGKLTKRNDGYLWHRKPEFATMSRHNGGIGKTAIQKMCNKWKETHYHEPEIKRELKFGKKKIPLGRYLTDVLVDENDVSETQKQIELFIHQESIIEKYFPDDDSSLLKNLLDDRGSARRSREKRLKIFKQGRSI
jgi:hypothetical protein